MKQYEYPQEILELLEFGRYRKPGQCEPDENNTIPLDLLEVNAASKKCEECDINIIGTRVVYSKRLIKPYPHWSRQCQACKMYQCSLTGEYKLDNTELRHQHMTKAGIKIPESKRQLKPKIITPSVIDVTKNHSISHNPGGRPKGSKNKPKTLETDK